MRVAVSGSGYIADVHARAVRAAGGVVVAATNHRAESLAAFARRHDVPRTYETVEQLLADGSVDALVVATPNFLHAHQASSALSAGVSVLLEKPMATTADAARTIADAARTSTGTLMMAHCMRFDTQVRWIRDVIMAATIGDVIRTTARSVQPGFGPAGWFLKPALAGGGALMDLGVHAIDATRFVLGDPTPAKVAARCGTYFTEAEVEDTVDLTIEWDTGIVSEVRAGWWHPYDAGPSGNLEVLGTGGYAQSFPGRLITTDGADHAPVPRFTAKVTDQVIEERYVQQMKHFRRVIEGDADASPSGADGVTSMLIIDAAYESSRRGGEQITLQGVH